MAKRAVAENLWDYILTNDVPKVEEFLNYGDSVLWRQVIRYEFEIESVKHPEFTKLLLIPKLKNYEIKTLSSFNLAALLGAYDIMITLMEKDIPVDMPSISGTTALHMACFSGHGAIVQLLVEVYKADVHRVDRYGWSALHYASTEGHLDIVKMLVKYEADVNVRDQDGTTATFRAKVNGHDHVVQFLLLHVSDDDHFRVINRLEPQLPAEQVTDLYAEVNKPPTQSAGMCHNASSEQRLPTKNQPVSVPAERSHSISEECMHGGYSTESLPVRRSSWQSDGSMSGMRTQSPRRKNNIAPNLEKKESIRKLIRTELKKSFGPEEQYEIPVSEKTGSTAAMLKEDLKGIGANTLTGIMRDEFLKYRHTLEKIPAEPAPLPPMIDANALPNEDTYASLDNLQVAPSPLPHARSDAPPLPPRNPTIMRRKMSLDQQDEKSLHDKHLTLASQHLINPALTKSFERLASLLGKNWKKLAHALPLADNPTKTDERISAIERRTKTSVSEQALEALIEWQVKKGQEASVDALVIALRKCNLHNAIPEIEKITQEFTA